jgi:two-component system response regulator FlrC
MTRPGTVLVVEDHPGVMALAVEVLEGAGWSVVRASSASEAHSRLAEAEIDAVVSDVQLPGGNGEVPTYAGDARGRRPRLVYMSGDTARAAVQRQPGTEGARCLEKPFAPEALLAALAY